MQISFTFIQICYWKLVVAGKITSWKLSVMQWITEKSMGRNAKEYFSLRFIVDLVINSMDSIQESVCLNGKYKESESNSTCKESVGVPGCYYHLVMYIQPTKQK